MHREPVGLLAAARTGWSTEQLPLAVDGVRWPARPHAGRPAEPGGDTRDPGTRWAPRPAGHPGPAAWTSGGNPLFALELAKRDCSGIPRDLFGSQDAPESLRLVPTRIAALPAGARDVLLVCALATDTSLPVICAASSSPAVAQSDLEEGIRSGTVTINDGAVTFAHPVIRSVIAGEARPADRRAAHQRLAAVVRNTEARARHLALGTQAPDEAAAQAVEEAARAAVRRGACDAAGDLAELAVAVTRWPGSRHASAGSSWPPNNGSHRPTRHVPVHSSKPSSAPSPLARPAPRSRGVWPVTGPSGRAGGRLDGHAAGALPRPAPSGLACRDHA